MCNCATISTEEETWTTHSWCSMMWKMVILRFKNKQSWPFPCLLPPQYIIPHLCEVYVHSHLHIHFQLKLFKDQDSLEAFISQVISHSYFTKWAIQRGWGINPASGKCCIQIKKAWVTFAPFSTMVGMALSSLGSGRDHVLEIIKLSGLLEWNGWKGGVQRTLPVSKSTSIKINQCLLVF